MKKGARGRSTDGKKSDVLETVGWKLKEIHIPLLIPPLWTDDPAISTTDGIERRNLEVIEEGEVAGGEKRTEQEGKAAAKKERWVIPNTDQGPRLVK